MKQDAKNHESKMWIKRFALIIGFFCPFVMASLFCFVLIQTTGWMSDGVWHLYFILCILGSPTIGVVIIKWLPTNWPSGVKSLVAIVTTFVIFPIEFFGSVFLLVGMARAFNVSIIE